MGGRSGDMVVCFLRGRTWMLDYFDVMCANQNL